MNRRYKRATTAGGMIQSTYWPSSQYLGRAGAFDLYRKDGEGEVYFVVTSVRDPRLTENLLKQSGGNVFYFRYDPDAKAVAPLSKVGLNILNPTPLEMIHIYKTLKETHDGERETDDAGG